MARGPRTLRCRRLLTPSRIVSPALVEISEGRIRDVREAGPTDRADYDLEGTVVPGFIDLQVNGYGPHDVASGDAAALEAISARLVIHGVTSWLPTVVSCPEPQRLAAIDAVASARERFEGARILGVHLEGPWISGQRAGAHRPEWIVEPLGEVVERSLGRHPGVVRLVTCAPEVPGGLDLIRQVTATGAIASIGHSDADYTETQAAVACGARFATHLFNAMRPPHHREPGVVGAVLDDVLVTAGLIADGVHVHDATIRLVFRAKGAHRVALVSDLAADDAPTLADPGPLAGSRVPLSAGVANAVGAWVPLEDAAAAASQVPADLLGEPIGRIEPGLAADMVLLDEDLRPTATFVGGDLAWRA